MTNKQKKKKSSDVASDAQKYVMFLHPELIQKMNQISTCAEFSYFENSP